MTSLKNKILPAISPAWKKEEEEEEEATSDDSIVSLEKRDMPDLPSTLLPMERTKHDEICAEGGAEGGAEGVRIVE